MTQTGPDTLTTGWLTETRRAGEIVATIADSLLVLFGKRTTLEEKSIGVHYNRLAAEYGVVISSAHRIMAGGGTLPPEDELAHLTEVNIRVKETLEHFLKVATYDANFLEQYFEFDYNTRLTEEYRFDEEVKRIADLLRSSV